MNASPPEATPPGKWRSHVNALLLTAGLSIVFVAIGASHRSKTQVPAGPPGAVRAGLDAEAVLAGMPKPATPSQEAQAMAKALEKCRRLPGNANAWILLGDLLAQGQRETSDAAYFDHAEKAYRMALGLKPEEPSAMAGMAWVMGGRHQFDLSILWAEKALALQPDNVACQGILGDAYVELGDYDKAFDYYQKMMDLRPDLSSWSRGAQLLWLTGQQTRAVMLMRQAVRSGGPFEENTAWCRAGLAMMLFHDGALLPAAQALEPTLSAGTTNIRLLLAAGRIAMAREDFPAAISYYQLVLKRGPHLEALASLGDIAAVRGSAEEAEGFYKQVEALHAAHRQTGVHDHMEMARFYADHDRSPSEALRLAVEHGEARNVFEWDTLAWVRFRNGQQPQAIEAIKRALQTGTPDAAIHYHAGCIAAAAGDRVAAQKHLEQSLSMNPAFHPLHAPLAAKLIRQLGSEPRGIPEVSTLPVNRVQPLTRLR